MSSGDQFKASLRSLSEEAAKVAGDIGALTKQAAALSSEKSAELREQLTQSCDEQLKKLQERLQTLNGDLHVHARQADEHIRKNPYLYILSALGLGLLLGKFLLPRSRN